VARACGAQGYSIEDPAECAATLKQALATPGPVLIEAVVDPNEPPMPPRATLRQVTHLAESLARGTPDGGRVARTIARDVIRELV
jgi:pyruvate dehydrogenase (quinone)/pyruvate oxidase